MVVEVKEPTLQLGSDGAGIHYPGAWRAAGADDGSFYSHEEANDFNRQYRVMAAVPVVGTMAFELQQQADREARQSLLSLPVGYLLVERG